MNAYQKACRRYFQILLIWRGQSTQKISVSKAIQDLKTAKRAVQLRDPMYPKLNELMQDIINNAYAPDEEAMAG